MAAIMNGIALHGGFIPYGGTFLVFSDYARNAVRMSRADRACARSTSVRTIRSASARTGRRISRSSISASLRLIPQHARLAPVRCGRDRGGVERGARAQHGPTVLVSRARTCRTQHAHAPSRSQTSRAAATCSPDGEPARRRCIVIATGSEVQLALGAAQELASRGIARARRVDAVHERVRRAADALPRRACCRPACVRARDRGRRDGRLVALRRRRAAACIGIDRSAHRRRPRPCSSTSASPSRPSRARPTSAITLARAATSPDVRVAQSACSTSDRRSVIGDQHGRQSRHQRLRPHRPQHPARALRSASARNEIQIVAINDLGDAETNAHLTRYDTAHGKFPGEVEVEGDALVVNGDRSRSCAERDPAEAAVGRARRRRRARVHGPVHDEGEGRRAHRTAARRKSSSRRRATRTSTRPSSTASTTDAQGERTRSSRTRRARRTASRRSRRCCTTRSASCSGLMTTIHAYTNDQVLTDVYPRGPAPRALGDDVA